MKEFMGNLAVGGMCLLVVVAQACLTVLPIIVGYWILKGIGVL